MVDIKALIEEIKYEARTTKAHLAEVPMDKLDWAPHEKSMKMGALAVHIGDLAGWIDTVLQTEELDFEKITQPPFVPTTAKELVDYCDQKFQKGISVLEVATPEQFEKTWTLRSGDYIIFSLPKSEVIRIWTLNHIIHHRAQLGVYLRLNNLPVPGAYGPSADTM